MPGRTLTIGETAMAATIFGRAIDYARVRIHNRKWAFFQPRSVTMAPDGGIWFHPDGRLYCEDFATADTARQGLFIHEMTHVWQAQKGVILSLVRHPFCRYDFTLVPGRPLDRYGIEQQAEIVRHTFLARRDSGAMPELEDVLLSSGLRSSIRYSPVTNGRTVRNYPPD